MKVGTCSSKVHDQRMQQACMVVNPDLCYAGGLVQALTKVECDSGTLGLVRQGVQ